MLCLFFAETQYLARMEFSTTSATVYLLVLATAASVSSNYGCSKQETGTTSTINQISGDSFDDCQHNRTTDALILSKLWAWIDGMQESKLRERKCFNSHRFDFQSFPLNISQGGCKHSNKNRPDR